MKEGLYSKSSPILKLILSVFIFFVSFFIITVIGILIAIPIFKINIFNLDSLLNFTNPENIGFLKYLQAVQSIGFFVLPPFIIGFLIERNSIKYLQLDIKPKLGTIIIAVFIIFCSLPFINYLVEVNSHLHLPHSMGSFENWMKETEKNAELITNAFLKTNNFSGLLINIFIIAVLPALGEELLFRGVLQKLFIEMTKNIHLGIWITALLFSAFHLQFFGFLPRTILGVIFGYFLVWSKSIWVPILAHFIVNSMSVIAFYLADHKITGNQADTVGATSETFILAIFSCILIFALMGYMHWIEKPKDISPFSNDQH
jgi:uncharacterized protein